MDDVKRFKNELQGMSQHELIELIVQYQNYHIKASEEGVLAATVHTIEEFLDNTFVS